jgi:hypothetical protein
VWLLEGEEAAGEDGEGVAGGDEDWDAPPPEDENKEEEEEEEGQQQQQQQQQAAAPRAGQAPAVAAGPDDVLRGLPGAEQLPGGVGERAAKLQSSIASTRASHALPMPCPACAANSTNAQPLIAIPPSQRATPWRLCWAPRRRRQTGHASPLRRAGLSLWALAQPSGSAAITSGR